MRQGNRSELSQALQRTRRQTWGLFERLTEAQWQVPHWNTINPPRWELGHLAWFQEFWCVRGGEASGRTRRASIVRQADALYDSGRVPHAARWALPLLDAPATRAYLDNALDATLGCLAQADEDDAALQPFRLALFHEQMHAEAFAATWQALGYARPATLEAAPASDAEAAAPADVAFEAATVYLGTPPGPGFAFDNERSRHAVRLEAFAVASRPVTNAEFAAFVDAGGYREPRWWTPEAFEALRRDGRAMPAYWRRDASGFAVRAFDRLERLRPHEPVMHVSAHEAEAWCRWAGRRLPTEAEWEAAAASGRLPNWGSRVWEWTASAFEPYPGFSAGAYRSYSQPWFGTHRSARGGSAATARDLVDARFRNFWRPERADPFTGFRSCAR